MIFIRMQDLKLTDLGPGQSVEDVKWLDKNLREFFAGN